jgi:cell division protein FtsN
VADSHEPSYYEIALTNRQVMVAFVILLVCLLSAFFSGVWIGREGTARAQERLASNLQQKPAAPASDEGRQLQELEFFDSDSRGEETAGPDQDATEPPSEEQPTGNDTTLLEDFAGEEPQIETQPAPEEEPAEEPEARQSTPPAPPAAAPAKAPEEETRAERRKRLAREREERAAAEPKPAAEPARAPRAAEPKIPRGSAVIQVFSSADQEQAERIRDRLVSGGYKAYLSPVETGGRTMYRVRIGPYGSRSDADTAAANVRKNYKLDTWVTE